MADVSVACTSCRREISFDVQHGGSIQQCPHCGQQLIVPNAAQGTASSNLPAALAARPSPVPAATPVVERHMHYMERAQEAQTSRKLKMGSGCFAMLAVMFAVGLVGTGIAVLFPEVDQQRLYGLSAVFAGLAGLAAFVYFGYIATETASSSSDRGRS
jgi:predicted RNA-binding Zn-ribbon protein involved in translation (DUF1610 family)